VMLLYLVLLRKLIMASVVLERAKKELGVGVLNSLSDEWQRRIVSGYSDENEAITALAAIAKYRKQLPPRVHRDTLAIVCECMQSVAGGYDENGHLIWLERIKNPQTLLQLKSSDVIKARILVTEAMEALKKKGQYKHVYILDLKQCDPTMIRQKKIRILASRIIHLGEKYYPAGIHQIYVINAPIFIRTLYAVLRPFIHINTRKKITFLSSKNYLTYLQKKKCPSSIIPQAIGGAHPDITIQQLLSLPTLQQSTKRRANKLFSFCFKRHKITTRGGATKRSIPPGGRALCSNDELTYTRASNPIPDNHRITIATSTSRNECPTTREVVTTDESNNKRNTTRMRTSYHQANSSPDDADHNYSIRIQTNPTPTTAIVGLFMILFTFWFSYF